MQGSVDARRRGPGQQRRDPHRARAWQALVIAFALGIVAGCTAGRPYGRATIVEERNPPRTIEIAATRSGFDPARVDVRVGETVRLVFTRTTPQRGMERVQIWLGEGESIDRPLTFDVPVVVTLRFDVAGELGYACGGLDHGGAIYIRESP